MEVGDPKLVAMFLRYLSGGPLMQVGDKVVKNPETWRRSNFEWAGEGVGVIVDPPFETEPNVYDVRWPNGRCFQWETELLPAPEGSGHADR